MARSQNWSLLRRRFKTAVKNLLNASKRHLASIMSRGASCFNRQSRSFDHDRYLGLHGIDEEDEESDHESSSVRALQRTRSYAYSYSDDAIDRRADIFISNFRRRLLYERQVSLELRYRAGT